MWSTLSVSGSGLAASAAQLSTAANRVVRAFTSGPAPKVPATQPAPSGTPTSASVAGPLAGATKLAAQDDEPASWMVEILRAKASYQANVAAERAALATTKATIDMLG